jgi:PAS domain S-box-containing protein
VKNDPSKTKADPLDALQSLEAQTHGTTLPEDAFHAERIRLLHELHVHQVELEAQNQELREAQARLEESRDRYADLYDFAPVGYMTLDAHGLIEEINLTATTLLGRARGRLIGTPFRAYVTAADGTAFLEHLRQARQTAAPATCELSLALKDRPAIPVQLVSLAVRNITGEITHFRTTVGDITERKKAEGALRISEERFRALIEHSYDAITLIAADGTVLYDSPSIERVLGYTPTERIGRKVFEFVPPQEREGMADGFARFAQLVGAIARSELRFISKDGTLRSVEGVRVNLLREPAVRAVVVNYRDITERKQAEQALQQYHQDMARAQQIGHLGSWKWDMLGQSLSWSDELYRIFGVPHDFELTYEAIEARMHPEDRPENTAQVQRLMTSSTQAQYEFRIIRPDGEVRHIYQSIETTRDETGAVTGMFGIMQDITERRQAEETLRRTVADLARSNAELEQFAYVASHDLQEPLRMVSSYMQLLAKSYQGQLDAEADEFIGYAVDGAQRMQGLISDLLAYARVGTRGQPAVPTDCEAVLTQVLDDLECALAESQAQVTHDPLPTVLADAGQLAQLFQNLIGNAIKFHGAEPPRVHVSAQLQIADRRLLTARPAVSGIHETNLKSQIGNPQSEWLFAVRDNGIGIEPEYWERIFVIFQRLHLRTEYPGTGIGLAICKKIVERHGGRIWVESDPGQGSTFYFTLPQVGDPR